MKHGEKLERLEELARCKKVMEYHALLRDVTEYEDQNVNIGKPTLIESVKFRRDQMNMNQGEFAEFIGIRKKTLQVLEMKGSEGLGIGLARKLGKAGIPLDVILS